MDDIITLDQLEAHLRREVVAAGSAKKWCRKNKVSMDHALHMIANGSAAGLPSVREALGFREVRRYERIAPMPSHNGTITAGDRDA